MAVFHIHIGKRDGHIGEILPGRDLDAANLHGCAQAFVGLTDELLNNFVFEKIDGDAKRDDQNHQRQEEIKQNFLCGLQAEKIVPQKYR